MSTVLLTGGSGFVGSHVLPALTSAGHRPRVLVRSEAAGTSVTSRLDPTARAAIELADGDVAGPGAVERLAQAMTGVDAVVHLVALPRDWNGGKDLRRVNTQGTANVLAAMKAAGVHRIVHLGALGVVDDPRLHYASSKAKAEAACAASELDYTILKPSLLWGERDGFCNTIADLVRLSPGIVPVPGDGSSRFQPLSVDDLARIVVLSLERPDTIGHTFELGGPRYWTYREILEEVMRALGKHRAVVPMPVPIIGAVARVSEAVHLPFPVSSDLLRQLGIDNIGPLEAVRTSFAFEPRDMAGNLGYLRAPKKNQ